MSSRSHPAHRLLRAAAGLALAVVCATTRAFAAPAAELGHPVIRHYTPGEHLRGLTTPALIQDPTGTILSANEGDLLTFDGAHWGYIRLPTESAGVREFAVTADGTIFLAGASVLGFLRGAGETAAFVSLADHLPPAHRNIDELFHAAALGRAVFFSDEEKILIWRDDSFAVVPFATPPHSHGPRFHRVGDTLYVTALGYGLGRLARDAVDLVSADPLVRENQIIAVESGADGALVLLTAERGFFQLSPAGKVAPLPTDANRWLAGKRIFRALRLPDGSRAVAFSAMSGDGGMRFAPDGTYVGPLDTSIGLVVKTIRGFLRDSEGGLWAGTEAGAARLEWPSPVTVFDVVNGLGQGAVADVARRDGVLYA
ncbi:MAG: hypothetical protein RLZZ15_3986, partial [Verrucomicrobiota bacterium]